MRGYSYSSEETLFKWETIFSKKKETLFQNLPISLKGQPYDKGKKTSGTVISVMVWLVMFFFFSVSQRQRRFGLLGDMKMKQDVEQLRGWV